MAVDAEDWNSWGAADSDGLDELPWTIERRARVVESKPKSANAPKKRNRTR